MLWEALRRIIALLTTIWCRAMKVTQIMVFYLQTEICCPSSDQHDKISMSSESPITTARIDPIKIEANSITKMAEHTTSIKEACRVLTVKLKVAWWTINTRPRKSKTTGTTRLSVIDSIGMHQLSIPLTIMAYLRWIIGRIFLGSLNHLWAITKVILSSAFKNSIRQLCRSRELEAEVLSDSIRPKTTAPCSKTFESKASTWIRRSTFHGSFTLWIILRMAALLIGPFNT